MTKTYDIHQVQALLSQLAGHQVQVIAYQEITQEALVEAIKGVKNQEITRVTFGEPKRSRRDWQTSNCVELANKISVLDNDRLNGRIGDFDFVRMIKSLVKEAE